MSTPTDPGVTAPSKRNGCGARGCLFGCLTPIVAFALALLFALPTLRDKWTAFQAENPWVAKVPGIATVLKDVAAGPKKDSSAADTSRAARSKPLKGVDDKTAMPSDLPLWPRPKAETFSIGKGHAAAYQLVRQSPDSVLRYYRRAMPAKGWRLDQERKGAGGTLLLYRKSSQIARIEVVPDTAGTDLWLRSRTFTPPPTR